MTYTRQQELIHEIAALEPFFDSAVPEFLENLSLTVLLNIKADLEAKGSADGRR